MMSDERFFAQVKTTLSDYSPEVPAAVYSGMRRKLWWAQFTRLSATRFNMWYLLLMLGISGGVAMNYFSKDATASRSTHFVPALQVAPAAQITMTSGPAVCQSAATSCSQVASCCSSGAKMSASACKGSSSCSNTVGLSKTNDQAITASVESGTQTSETGQVGGTANSEDVSNNTQENSSAATVAAEEVTQPEVKSAEVPKRKGRKLTTKIFESDSVKN
jgi:hypothetical protein